jgi:hypothetical protein
VPCRAGRFEAMLKHVFQAVCRRFRIHKSAGEFASLRIQTRTSMPPHSMAYTGVLGVTER